MNKILTFVKNCLGKSCPNLLNVTFIYITLFYTLHQMTTFVICCTSFYIVLCANIIYDLDA